MLDYNVPGGKLNRGLAVGDILGHLQQDKASSSISSAMFQLLTIQSYICRVSMYHV